MKFKACDSRFQEDFSQWFDGSVVREASGDPKVVFHGTDSDFQVFRFTNDIGYHFGGLEAAENRLKLGDLSSEEYLEGANVRLVVLALKRPLRLPDLFDWSPRNVVRGLIDTGVVTDRIRTELIDMMWVRRTLRRAGYDGIVYRNETEGGGDSYIVFSNRQIRPWTAARMNRVTSVAA